MVKAIVFVTDADYHPDFGMRFFLNITETYNGFFKVQGVIYESGLDPDDSKNTINTAIENFAQNYAIQNWGSTFGPGDIVRIIIGVDN